MTRSPLRPRASASPTAYPSMGDSETHGASVSVTAPIRSPPQTSAPQKRLPEVTASPRASAVPSLRPPRPGYLPLGGHQLSLAPESTSRATDHGQSFFFLYMQKAFLCELSHSLYVFLIAPALRRKKGVMVSPQQPPHDGWI